MLAVGASVGGTRDWAALRPGGTVTLIFGPASAAQFMPPLYDWNTSLVFQGEYRSVDVGRDLISIDTLLRRRLGPFRDPGPGASLFVGGGLGIGLASYPAGGGSRTRDPLDRRSAGTGMGKDRQERARPSS